MKAHQARRVRLNSLLIKSTPPWFSFVVSTHTLVELRRRSPRPLPRSGSFRVGGPRSHELSSVDSCGKLERRAPLDLLWIIKKEMKQAKLPWESPQWSHETDEQLRLDFKQLLLLELEINRSYCTTKEVEAAEMLF